MITIGPGETIVLARTRRSQRGCRGCRCLLDGSGMMVLVASQGRPASECFLTIGKGTLVRTLSRVSPAVASQ